MEIFRYTQDAWGQRSLEGVSWDLLAPVIGVTIAIIIVHALCARLFTRRDES